MHYKIESGSELYERMMQLQEECKEANKVCQDYVNKTYGDETKWASDNYCIGGGLKAVQLDEKPEGYKSVGDSWQHLFQPYARNKKAWKEWDALPKVKQDELKSLLNYGNYSGAKQGGFMMSTLPNVYWKEDFILVKCAEFATSYEPVEGMTEILASEFNELNKD